jgi:hypothetical protein
MKVIWYDDMHFYSQVQKKMHLNNYKMRRAENLRKIQFGCPSWTGGMITHVMRISPGSTGWTIVEKVGLLFFYGC